jgi:hypothetical protein
MVESIHQTIKKYYIPRSEPLTYIQLNEMFAFAVDIKKLAWNAQCPNSL